MLKLNLVSIILIITNIITIFLIYDGLHILKMEEIKQKAKQINQASRGYYGTKSQTNGKHP